MTSVRNQLIAEYLQRLDTASAFLSADRRTELGQEIREHIDAAMDEVENLDAEAVRGILARLGPPAEIVAAELGTRSTGSIPVPVVESAGPAPVPVVEGTGEGEVRGSGHRTLLLGCAATAVVLFGLIGAFAMFGTVSQDSGPAPSAPNGRTATPPVLVTPTGTDSPPSDSPPSAFTANPTATTP
ncbi:HAAS signaling domain-containing protein [Streptomyces sp. NPDC087420]|uniref:HAAS signaling domain-containing protein n=1 Tax=Streptomyces sp. NPDC087420 TaxID=3365785 RepID=UPI003833C41D